MSRYPISNRRSDRKEKFTVKEGEFTIILDGKKLKGNELGEYLDKKKKDKE